MSRQLTVMVTGASAGVGRATSIAFARRGASVGLLARGRAGLEAAARDVEASGGQPVICQGDVSHMADVDAAATTLEEARGPIDVWVNNAMASVFSPVAEMTAEDYERVTAVTYLGFVHGTLAALRRMRPRDRGVIVQVGSALAYRGIPLQSAYCAAKHAIQGFCDSLRCELLHDRSRIHLTMVQLPALNTPQFDWVKSRLPGRAQPVPPIYAPEMAAQAIVWASEHRRREMYVTWQTVKAIVGDKIAPGVLDWYLSEHGFDSQQTDQPEDPERPHNLWTPVDEECDFGAHGRFVSRTRSFSMQVMATKHRTAAAAGLLAAGALVAVGIRGAADWWSCRS